MDLLVREFPLPHAVRLRGAWSVAYWRERPVRLLDLPTGPAVPIAA
ncbi:MAG: hypothetical protein U1E83_01815 [Methylotetracoccus sp.]